MFPSFLQMVAEVVCETLASLSEQKRHLVFSFLHHTKITMVCEILNPKSMHIVDLSHLNVPKICVLAMTPTVSTRTTTSLCAMAPHDTLKLVAALGFESPRYEVITTAGLMDRKLEVSYSRHVMLPSSRELAVWGQTLNARPPGSPIVLGSLYMYFPYLHCVLSRSLP